MLVQPPGRGRPGALTAPGWRSGAVGSDLSNVAVTEGAGSEAAGWGDVRRPPSAWDVRLARRSGIALVPMRLLLGGTYHLAGVQKLTAPGFQHPGPRPTSHAAAWLCGRDPRRLHPATRSRCRIPGGIGIVGGDRCDPDRIDGIAAGLLTRAGGGRGVGAQPAPVPEAGHTSPLPRAATSASSAPGFRPRCRWGRPARPESREVVDRPRQSCPPGRPLGGALEGAPPERRSAAPPTGGHPQAPPTSRSRRRQDRRAR